MKAPWSFVALLPALAHAQSPALEHEKGYINGTTPSVVRIGESEVKNNDQATPPGQKIQASDMSVICSSEVDDHKCSNVLDSDTGTYWQSENGDIETITVDLQEEQSISGLVMVPYNESKSYVEKHSVSVSQDNENWKEVAYGMWWPDGSEKFSVFQPEKGRYLRLTKYGSSGLISELEVYTHAYIPPDPSKGAWGPTIDLPLVPVSGAIDARTGELVGWSSWSYDYYLENIGGWTQTTTWNPTKRTVTQRQVSNTQHDMFCTGISLDEDGNFVVTGGNSAHVTSLYNITTGEWEQKQYDTVDRGYQASTILSDGRIFMIGGSFNGWGKKDGEVYDVRSDHWDKLKKAKVSAMLTSETQKWRKDNHGWFFGWTDGYVFQAGPSKQMNWYGTEGDGSTVAAGQRTDADAMCGNAVMFDDGKIVAFGGSPKYENSTATKDTFVISIDEPNTEVSVVETANMKYRRTFHSSVALPDGSVLSLGGQDVGIPFDESGSHYEPERFVYNAEDPAASTWEPLLPNTVARVYHSLALLLQDGTVFVGGGGLCANCTANHFDGQIFTPPYLLNEDGTLRERPEISVESTCVEPGQKVKITANTDVKTEASIIRYGSATHTVNTDQRRIGVTLTPDDGDSNAYTFQIPEKAGVAVPGYYMVFVLDSQGTPSESVNIRVASENEKCSG